MNKVEDVLRCLPTLKNKTSASTTLMATLMPDIHKENEINKEVWGGGMN